eukprot:6669676-Pyramimonas_sp.AAC.1
MSTCRACAAAPWPSAQRSSSRRLLPVHAWSARLSSGSRSRPGAASRRRCFRILIGRSKRHRSEQEAS